ncbi:hypothetical protein [Methylobacter sp.]|uniref:hypothetical protein n=1 Tax=Methylobacter sp. TaxID=2051955 RepID=UPI00120D0549|nr:hypothetical protein [Methylobacter sp.]TAK62729.1 MAG: hypothetical protein EPO18_09455 [Methylobacter sp.]
MKIVQKKRSNKHTFTFNDESFNFAYEDKKGSDDVDMRYADFPQKSSVSIEQNEWLRNVAYLWCGLGLYQLGYAIYSDASLSGKGFWLINGLVCLAWAHLSKVKYSVFKTDRGNIFVIQDKKHDLIVKEINERRRKQLLQWYGEIDMENEPENEIRKFNWLCEQKVISKEEAEIKIAQIELAHKNNMPLLSDSLN